jgi:hypothetical protein
MAGGGGLSSGGPWLKTNEHPPAPESSHGAMVTASMEFFAAFLLNRGHLMGCPAMVRV